MFNCSTVANLCPCSDGQLELSREQFKPALFGTLAYSLIDPCGCAKLHLA